MARMKLQQVTPAGCAAVVALEAAQRRGLPRSVQELVKLRASARNGCGDCLAMHTRDASRHGESERQIAALTDVVTRLPDGGVPDAVYDDALNHWGEQGVGRLLLAIATINVWNRIAITSGLEASDL